MARLRGHPELNRRLFWLNGISAECLDKVFATSICLIAASEGEGFGLPLIEAAKHQLAIIARDIPVFREVAGQYATYFAGMQPGDLAGAIKSCSSRSMPKVVKGRNQLACLGLHGPRMSSA